MQKVQLYVGGELLDLFDDESISLTQTIQNVKDIGSIFTDFSKSFAVPSSKKNNKIFKHYYNFEINNGFNGNDKIRSEIHINSLLFRKGFMAMDGVQMKANKPYAYKLTFFGETVDLKKKLKEITIQTCFETFSDYNHEYSKQIVLQGLKSHVQSAGGKNVVYPLISHTNRLTHDTGNPELNSYNVAYDSNTNQGLRYTDLKPALKVSAIIDRISAFTGLEFNIGDSDSFFRLDNEVYDNLYLWFQRAKGNLGVSYDGSAFVNIPFTTLFENAQGGEWDPFNFSELYFNDTISAFSNIENGIWNSRGAFWEDGSEINFVTFTANWNVTSSSVFNMYVERVDGAEVVTIQSMENITTGVGFIQNIGNGQWGENEDVSIRFRITSTDPAFIFTTFIELRQNFYYWESAADPYEPPELYNYSYTINDVAPTTAVSNIIIADQIPRIKVLDFLTGIFKMFNLTAFVQLDGKIKVQTLDSFYETGTPREITQYIDETKSEINFSIPYQEIAFRYDKQKTFLAINYDEINNSTYGNLENSTQANDINRTDRGQKYVVKVPYEKFVYERLSDIETGNLTKIQYGWSVNKDQQPTLTSPLLFIRRNTPDASLSFFNGVSSGVPEEVTQYNRPANSLLNQTINFGAEVDEFTGEIKEDSLFNTYYKKYVRDVFDTRRRSVRMTAYLPMRILLNYSLADTFIIDGREYIINSITTNLQKGESKLELFNRIRRND
jgi:hypothetical protein